MITVAVDTGPLFGTMSGVGRAVDELVHEYRQRPSEIEVVPFVVSRRAALTSTTRRLPYPAAVAMAAWARFDRPRADRFVRGAQVLHGMNYVVPPSRLPRVVTVYDCWALENPDQVPPVVRRAMAVLRRCIDTGAVVHVPSKSTRDRLVHHFPDARIHLAPLGAPRLETEQTFETSRSRENSPTDHRGPYLLFVGTIERRKNLVRVIDAFARSASARSGVRLVLVGAPGDDSDRVHARLGELEPGVRSLIEFAGRVSESDLDRLYRQSRAVVYASIDEGFGFPILEAMARGVPVVAARAGSIPEIAAEAAEYADPFDIDSLAHAIDRIHFDETCREHLVHAGFERCHQFSWASTASSLIGLYESLARGS